MDWERLASVCAEVGAHADNEEPAIREVVELQRCATAPLVVRTTATSRKSRGIGSKRRHGLLPCKATGKFLDSNLARDLPKGPPELYRPVSAPALGRRPASEIDPRRAALCRAQEALSGTLPAWKSAVSEEKRASVAVAKATRTSEIREALGRGMDGPEEKRMWGELDGIGLGIGDRKVSGVQPTPTPGRYDEADGGIARWRVHASFPSKQPCAKYRSAAAPTMCPDRTRPRYESRRSGSVSQQKRPGTAPRPTSAPFKTIAETHGHLNVHEYIGAVMKRYQDQKLEPQVRGRRNAVRMRLRDIAEAVKAKGEGSLDHELGIMADLRFDKAEFAYLLEQFGLPAEEYGRGNAKSLNELWHELCTAKDRAKTTFEAWVLPNGQARLLRHASVVVVELYTDVGGRDVFLLLKYTFTDDGSSRWDLNTRVTRKMLAGDDPVSATWRCLVENLNITEAICKDNFVIEDQKVVEEQLVSEGFPGLMTHYNLHVVRVRMLARCLPTTAEFMTTVQGEGSSSGSKRVWVWASRAHFESLFPPTEGE